MEDLLLRRRAMMEHSKWKGISIGEDTPGISMHRAYLNHQSASDGYKWRYYTDASTSVRIPIKKDVRYRLHLEPTFSSSIYMVAFVSSDDGPTTNNPVNTYNDKGESAFFITCRNTNPQNYNDRTFKINSQLTPDIKYLVIQVGGMNWETSTESQRYTLFNKIHLEEK